MRRGLHGASHFLVASLPPSRIVDTLVLSGGAATATNNRAFEAAHIDKNMTKYKNKKKVSFFFQFVITKIKNLANCRSIDEMKIPNSLEAHKSRL